MSYMSYTTGTVTDKAIGNGDSLVVLSGGVANASTVSGGGVLTAYSGGTVYQSDVTSNTNGSGVVNVDIGGVASDTQLHGGAQFVSGGAAYGTRIFSGGFQQVSGSTVYGTVILDGGEQNINFGSASGTVISSGGTQLINSVPGSLSAGIASTTNILNGGFELLASGGSDYASVVHKGGVEWVNQGGTANNISIADSGTLALFGSAADGTDVYDGNFSETGGGGSEIGSYSRGTETIIFNLGGGTPIIKTVSSGGTIDTYSGSNLYEKAVQSGDEQTYTVYNPDGSVEYTGSNTNYVYAGSAGSAAGATVASGGTLVLAGGTLDGMSFAKGAIIAIGGPTDLAVDGASETISVTNVSQAGLYINPGVSAYVKADNDTTGAQVLSGGFEDVATGGSMSGTIISKGGLAAVESKGSATKTQIDNGTLVVVGQADSSTISGNFSIVNVQVHSGGVTSGDNIRYGGVEKVSSGGVASNTDVVSGALVVINGGRLIAPTVSGNPKSFGDGLITLSGGTAVSAVIDSGGYMAVSSGGISTQTTISAHGNIEVLANGSATSTTIGDGGIAYISGVASFTVTQSGGAEIIASGGVTVSAKIQSGGFEKISAGGTAEYAQVQGGGNQTVFTSGNASETIIGSGGKQLVSGGTGGGATPPSSAGLSTSATILTGGTETVYAGGETVSSTVSGGTLALSGGYANAAILESGSIDVHSGGFAANTNVQSGILSVLTGGGASGGQIGKAGIMQLAAKASSTDISLLGGALATILTSGTDSGSSIADGARMIVAGTATAETIYGQMTINENGTVTSASIAGGTLELNGGTATGVVTFIAASGEFLAEKTIPTVSIVGFGKGDSVVLKAITYVSGATATVVKAGVVTISNGGQSYNLNIQGAAVGATTFTFRAGSILTDSAKAANVAPVRMDFLRPQPGAMAVAAPLFAADQTGRAMFITTSAPEMSAASATVTTGWGRMFYLHDTRQAPVLAPRPW